MPHNCSLYYILGLDRLELFLISKPPRSAKEQLESNLFEAQQQNSVIEVTKGQLEIQIQTVTQAKEVIQGESHSGLGLIAVEVLTEGNGKLS